MSVAEIVELKDSTLATHTKTVLDKNVNIMFKKSII